MSNAINGIHHVTAIAGNAQRNLRFYTEVLGLRLVKKTVNFDDPHTYHFYFGNEAGEPGTILTFFPWESIVTGRRGTRQATETAFSIPAGSMNFWLERMKQFNVIYNNPAKRFNEEYLTILDPDGLKLELVIAAEPDARAAIPGTIPAEFSIRGFHSVTLTLEGYEKTAALLTEHLNYSLEQEHVNRFRFKNNTAAAAKYIDLVCAPGERPGHVAGGSVHHVAFRIATYEAQMELHDILAAKGFNITPQIDRSYFKSLYFREPGGVLFEIATDIPGFATDETPAELGTHLRLPPQYESMREELEKTLPKL
ncbi:MAG: ring-cleaving dioxygenase [Chitinophagaceae bacterium]